MIQHCYRFSLIVAAMAAVLGGSTTAEAGVFRRTKTMTITYAWGAGSLGELETYEMLYPGYLPTADVTFYTNGTFDAVDNATGQTGGGDYEKRGRNLEITLVPNGPYGTVQYVGERISPGVFAGDILVNGVSYGIWKGQF